jgi:hypothetical protein
MRINMTTFDKREEAFERQFAHDEAVKFRANARRNNLLGLWAAEKLGLVGAEAYARAVVISDVERHSLMSAIMARQAAATYRFGCCWRHSGQ